MKIGHLHLKVRNLKRSESFYRETLMLDVTERAGDSIAFLSGTDMHHELALQHVGDSGRIPGRFDTGIYHIAFEVASRAELAELVKRLDTQDVPAYLVDHRISWAVYFADPDGHGVEVYWDTRGEPFGQRDWTGGDLPLSRSQLNGAINKS